jgi:hypothetical protein
MKSGRHDSQAYEFRVRGHLGETVLSTFPELQARARGPDTVLTGTLPDQAALHGVLAEFAWLGLELLELRRLPKLSESGDASSPRRRRGWTA